PTSNGADERHDDIGNQRINDRAERGADNHTDSKIDDIAAHCEFLEFLKHRPLPKLRANSDASRQVQRKSDRRRWRTQLIKPACTMTSRTAVCAFSLAGTIGSRSVLAHLPISDSAYLISAGLVSTNRLIWSGASLSCSLSAATKSPLRQAA